MNLSTNSKARPSSSFRDCLIIKENWLPLSEIIWDCRMLSKNVWYCLNHCNLTEKEKEIRLHFLSRHEIAVPLSVNILGWVKMPGLSKNIWKWKQSKIKIYKKRWFFKLKQKFSGRLRFEVKVGEKNLHKHQAFKFKFKFPENHDVHDYGLGIQENNRNKWYKSNRLKGWKNMEIFQVESIISKTLQTD